MGQIVEFLPNRTNYDRMVKIDNPYIRADIYATDITNSIQQDLNNWNKSSNLTWDVHQWNGDTVVGVPSTSTAASGDLTKTINIPSTGMYWILIKGVQGAHHKDSYITLSIDGTNKGSIETYQPFDAWQWFDFGFINLNSGSHSFDLNVMKQSYATRIYLYKMDTYSTESNHSKFRLDPSKLTFTQNATNQYNTAELDLIFHEEYLQPDKNPFSRIFCEYTDPMTLWIGNDDDPNETAKVMFGGYMTDRVISDDLSTLTISFMDRFFDLMREPVYKNLLVNTSTKSSATPDFPYIQFSSALETIRYLSEYPERGLSALKVIPDYGFYNNFSTLDLYNSISVSGFLKQWTKSIGNPAPCLELMLDKFNLNHCGVSIVPSCECVLFDGAGAPYDASIYNYLSFNYLCPSGSVNYPLQFNVGVTMYQAGQTPGQAVEYVVSFTGKSGQANTIGAVKPVLNGHTQQFKVDLNELFDKYANSSNYYVTKVRLFDSPNTTQIANRTKSIMYIDNAMAYSDSINLHMEMDQATDKPFDNIQTICNDINRVAYIEYGKQRKDDILVLAPAENEPADVEAVEGINVMGITNEQYAPLNYITNRVLKHFTYGENMDKVGISFYENLDSIFRFHGAIGSYESLSNVTNQADANLYAQRDLDKNSYPYVSFSMTLDGTVLIKPSDYVVSSVDSRALSGNQAIASITHEIDWNPLKYTTKIDVGRPSDEFHSFVNSIYLNSKKYANQALNNAYSSNALARRGYSGVGAFIKSGSQNISNV
jgi:hypothetical protein